MNTTEITGTRYHFGIEEDSYYLFMLQDEEGNYLMIQKALEFDKQDIELGMDTYYIEINDQGKAGYGGVETLVLEDKSIKITISGIVIVLNTTNREIEIDKVFKDLKGLITN